MDIKKELLKLKKERIIRLIVGIAMIVLGIPLYAICTLSGAIYIVPFGMVLSFVGIVFTMRSALHPNYHSLNNSIVGYDKCQQLHMIPPVGKNAELDKKIEKLEYVFYKKGYTLLNGKLLADDMKKEDKDLIRNIILNLGDIHKATDEALFKSYAHFTAVAQLRGLAKNKQAVIQKECVFRILYVRYYHLLNK